MSARVTAVLAAMLASSAASSHAGDFTANGSYVFDAQAVATFDFEDGVPEPLDPDDEVLVRSTVDDALSGSYTVSIPVFSFGGWLVDVPSSKRSYRASAWFRGGEGSARVTLVHDDSMITGGYATLFPTGRVTSDGWYELANDNIRIDGVRTAVVFGVFNHGSTPLEIDAVELAIDGTINGVVNPSCNGAVGAGACLPTQACFFNACVDLNAWVPPIPEDRDIVAQYMRNRLQFLFGPYEQRTLDLPAAMDAMSSMDSASDSWTYWNGFLLGVRRLHDWHTQLSGIGSRLGNPRPINVCFIEGDADLSQGAAPSHPDYLDMIVSHVGAEGETLGLIAGDRLVSVDGQHPTVWSRTLVDFYANTPVVSNHRTFPKTAANMRRLISRFAHEIEVVRCDPQAVSCGAVETIVISDLPDQDPDVEVDFVACDSRPLRHLADSPANHAGGFQSVQAGLLNESDAVEKIYGAEWTSLSTTTGSDGVGPALNAAVQLFKDDSAAGVIFDHRYGTGGTLAGCEIVWNWTVQDHAITYSPGRPTAEAEQPTQAQGIQIYNEALADGRVDFAGSNNPTTIPIALLITDDGSASDWLPLGMKGAPNVQIFGPYETAGAFSTRYELGYTLGMGYILASADTYIPDGNTINGTGVDPDVVVVPKQSDLLVGVDTVFEAALAWVRQELP